MKKKKIWLPIVIIIVVLAGAGALVWFLLSGGSSKSQAEIMTDSLKHSFGLEKVLDDDTDYEKFFKENILKLTMDLSLSSGRENVSGNVEAYSGKEQAYLLAVLKEGSEKLEMEGLLKDNKIYFTLKDLLSKYYYIDMKELANNNTKATSISSTKIVTYLTDSISSVITEDKIEKESGETRKVDGEEYNTTKYSYTLTGMDIYDIVKTFLDKVKNDKDLVKEFNASLESADMSFSDVYEQILESVAEIKEQGKLLTYKTYIYKGEAISSEITISMKSEQMTIPINFIINNVDGLYEAYVSVMGQRMAEFVVKEKKENVHDLYFSVMGEKMIEGTLEGTKDDFTLKINGTEKMDGNFNIKVTMKKNDTLEYTGKIEIDAEVEDGEDMTGTIKFESKKADSIPKVDVSNSAPYSEMTEKDKEIIRRFGASEIDYIPVENFSFN